MKYYSAVAIVIAALAFAGCGEDDPVASTEKHELSLGALLALSGTLSDFGTTSKVAVELAVEDINREMGTEIDLKAIDIRNTYTNPDSALAGLTAARGKGLRFMIGPMTSAEVATVKSYADANGMIIISPSSVARSLSIAGDNIFRLNPDDTYQAEAMTTMLAEDSLDALITVRRDDVWGNDLVALASDLYHKQGGTIYDSLKYDPASLNVSGLLATLTERVNEAVAKHGADRVGIYLLSFAEAELILAAASDIPVLSTVKWYGASAVAQSAKLATNAKAAAFAQTVGYPCPVFGLDESSRSRWEPLKARIEAVTHQDADVYSMAAYDAVWLAVKTYLATHTTHDHTSTIDAEVAAFKAEFPKTAAAYTGMTGRTELNSAGDRKIGNYDFWALRNSGSGPKWERAAVYNSTTKTLTRQ